MNRERTSDWINQARRDFESAESAMSSGFYEWTCFIAQQCAEKAVTALYQKFHVAQYGHDAADLLKKLGTRIQVPDEVISDARSLDTYHIRACYPDSYETGAPGDHFEREDADRALRGAMGIIRFCEDILARNTNSQGEGNSVLSEF